MMTPIGRLSDIEWGWLVAAIIFAWIKVRSEQATAEGRNFDDARSAPAHAALGMLAPSPHPAAARRPSGRRLVEAADRLAARRHDQVLIERRSR